MSFIAEYHARLEKVDEEVREAREAYVNNEIPSRDAKLKEVWEKLLEQRGNMQDQLAHPEQDGLHTPIEPDVKRPKKDGLKIKDETSTKNMPYMKSVDGLPQLWSLWEAGSPDQGIGAISLLGDRTRREKGFNRQRFHEWSTVASEIQQQAFQGGIHPRQRAEELELERKAIKASMPQYAKILMSQFKDRRVRYQGHPGTPQDPNTFPQPQIQENLDAKTMTELAQEAAQPDNVVHEPVPEPQLTHDAKIDWASLQ